MVLRVVNQRVFTLGRSGGVDLSQNRFLPPTVREGFVNKYNVNPSDVLGKYTLDPYGFGGRRHR